MKSLQLISLQHELGMAIGLDLRLQEMLEQFTRVCVRRLGLAGIDYFFYRDEEGGIHLPGPRAAGKLCHYLSLPRPRREAHAPNLLLALRESAESHHMDLSGEDVRHCFALPRTGFVVLRRLNSPLAPQVVELLKPIIRRLAISCQASIQHEQLLSVYKALREAEEKVTFQLYHDDLTLLPNRRGLMERLEQDLSRAQRHGIYGAVLFLDLDRFKTVNDTMGHHTGDLLLAKVAEILRLHVRLEDTVARLGGDEFVIVLTDLGGDLDRAHRKVNNLGRKFSALFVNSLQVGAHQLQVTPSIGVAMFPDSADGAEEVVRHADLAMYQAKNNGHNKIVQYNPRMTEEAASRLSMEKALRRALRSDDQLRLYFQPQFSADEELIGAEALLRWQPPGEEDMVPPTAFISLAEETGLMLELGRWVIGEACRKLMQLEREGLPETFRRLFVNISAVQFEQQNFVAELFEQICEYGVDPCRFGIELTESTLITQNGDTVEKMRALNELGVLISIDDFGKGYSCLSYLNSLPIDSLKVDQAFVRDVHRDKSNQAIVEIIMALGRSLDLSLIAEGIESWEEFACLRERGIENFQGYLLGRPQSFEQFRELVRSQRGILAPDLRMQG